MNPEPIEFARRGRIGFFALLGSSLFVILGAWLALRPESDRHTRLIGLGNVLFFGVCGFVFLRELRRPAIVLRLDPSGIEYRHPQASLAFHYAWSALDNVRVQNEERASLLVLTLRRSNEEDVPDWALAKGASASLAPKETILSPVALGTTAEFLAGEIERFRRYYAPTPFSASIVDRPDR